MFNNNLYFSIIDKSFMYKTDLPYDRNIFKVHSVSKVYYHILSNWELHFLHTFMLENSQKHELYVTFIKNIKNLKIFQTWIN